MLNDIINNSAIIQFVLYPILELKKDFRNIFILKKNKNRSSIQAFSTIASIVFCILELFRFHPGLLTFLNRHAAMLEIPANIQPVISSISFTLVVSGMTAFLSKTLIRFGCKLWYGDPDYIVSTKRLEELVVLFRAQNYNVTKEQVKQVIDFCIKSYRNAPRRAAARREDWQDSIEAIIYRADLLSFMQRNVLLIQQRDLYKQILTSIDNNRKSSQDTVNDANIASDLGSSDGESVVIDVEPNNSISKTELRYQHFPTSSCHLLNYQTQQDSSPEATPKATKEQESQSITTPSEIYSNINQVNVRKLSVATHNDSLNTHQLELANRVLNQFSLYNSKNSLKNLTEYRQHVAGVIKQLDLLILEPTKIGLSELNRNSNANWQIDLHNSTSSNPQPNL